MLLVVLRLSVYLQVLGPRPGCRQAALFLAFDPVDYVFAAHTYMLTDSVPGFVGCVLWIVLQIIDHVFALSFLRLSRMMGPRVERAN